MTFNLPSISPFKEMGDCEQLWLKYKSFEQISDILIPKAENLPREADFFRAKETSSELEKLRSNLTTFSNNIESQNKGLVANLTANLADTLKQIREQNIAPSKQFSNQVEAWKILISNHKSVAQKTLDTLRRAGIDQFGFRVSVEADFPKRMLDASPPPYCLYYQGYWDIIESPCVSVVGTRNPTKEGIQRTKKLVQALVEDKCTIVSGLALGIDTAAHQTAIEAKGKTIAVLGTPLQEQHPLSNKDLREEIAQKHLVISQFPVSAATQPWFFSHRNKLMSAIAGATIIVEAGETSGTRVQAKAALKQNRKLFILNSCFENDSITWPRKFEKQGAIRVRDYSDIKKHLNSFT